MTDRDIMQVSERPVQYSDAGYGYSWKYAGRWYPYDPSIPGERERYCDESGSRLGFRVLGVLCLVVPLAIDIWRGEIAEVSVIGVGQFVACLWLADSMRDKVGDQSRPAND